MNVENKTYVYLLFLLPNDVIKILLFADDVYYEANVVEETLYEVKS